MSVIRKAKEEDISGIMEIYNKEIKEGIATFDTVEKKLDDMEKWYKEYGYKNPLIVSEEKGKIIGWAALSKYSTRCAYSDTAELSLYVKDEFQGKGMGKKLMKFVLEEGRKGGLHTIIARITEGNESSVNLHKKFGFNYVGTYKEVGKKFGKTLDVVLMQKVYKD